MVKVSSLIIWELEHDKTEWAEVRLIFYSVEANQSLVCPNHPFIAAWSFMMFEDSFSAALIFHEKIGYSGVFPARNIIFGISNHAANFFLRSVIELNFVFYCFIAFSCLDQRRLNISV